MEKEDERDDNEEEGGSIRVFHFYSRLLKI